MPLASRLGRGEIRHPRVSKRFAIGGTITVIPPGTKKHWSNSMPDLDDVLREKTFKGQCDGDAQRVFYTLCDGEDLQLHRNSKFLSLLADHLLQRGLLTQEELDKILLEVIV